MRQTDSAMLRLLLLTLSAIAFARDKTPYQTTKLLEMESRATNFCFVVQVGDLAYLAQSTDKPGSNLVVGDPIEIKIKNDDIFVKVVRKYSFGSDTYTDRIKAKIRIRQRMTPDVKLPSCALAVTVH